MPAPLDPTHLRAALAGLPAWSMADDALVRTYQFPSFRDALAFMQFCSEDIERLAHHPTWTNTYDRVMVRLTTHDAGDKVTANDVVLAKTLDWAYSRVT